MTTQAFSTPKEPDLMQPTFSPISKSRLWLGRMMSGLPALFLLVDGGMKLFKPRVVVEATVQLGYPESVSVGLAGPRQGRVVQHHSSCTVGRPPLGWALVAGQAVATTAAPDQ